MASTRHPQCFYTDMAALLKQHKDMVQEVSGNMYDTLLRTLLDPNSDVGLVIQILEDIEQYISLLTKEYQPLVRVIMKLNWLDKGPVLISVYQSFMLNLVSAHVFYLRPCLQMLVMNFKPDQERLDSLGSSDEARKKLEQDFTHVHHLLKSLSQIVPLTSVILVQILESTFPYLNKSVSCFEHYTHNLLVISTYMPAQRLEILELLIKNMLKLDVRASRADISAVIYSDHLEVKEEDAVFDMEDALENQSQSQKQEQTAEDRLAAALPQAGSLDAMMVLCFQYIKDQCHTDGKLNWDVTKRLYRELLSVFEKFIFPTHASCHVQFLMFYICSFREALTDGFIDYLWKKVTDPAAQRIYRQTAAFYIGSFVTRAKYLPIKTAKAVVEFMMRWIHRYLDHTCDEGLRADVTLHAPFYSLCQSVFYIFCFKHNDFLEMKAGHKWAESLNFQRIVTSKLNPLRFCMPVIINTFASVARMYQLALCDTVIERNNRYSLPVTSSAFTVDSVSDKKIEPYFPFDPYLLPRSCGFIESLYREFRGSLPGEDSNENEDEDDFLPSEDEDISRSTDQISMSLGRSPMDFLQYEISPGFKHG